jgi:hypothetical protein
VVPADESLAGLCLRTTAAIGARPLTVRVDLDR